MGTGRTDHRERVGSVRVSLKVELLWERWGRVLGKTLELGMDGNGWGDGG